MASSFARYVALVEAETAARRRIRSNLSSALLRLWRPFDRYYDGRDVQQLGTRMGDLVLRSQVQTARVSEEFTRRTLEMQGAAAPGRRLDLNNYVYPRARIAAEVGNVEAAANRNVDPPATTAPDRVIPAAPRSVTVLVDGQPAGETPSGNAKVTVTVDDVYQRPVRQLRYRVSEDMPIEQAIQMAEQRLLTTAETDLEMAARQASMDVIDLADEDEVIGYRRVIHPELAKSGASCGLCIVASDRIYSRGELMPIHDHCNCLPSPITDSSDPGLRLNAEDLERLYKEAGGTAAKKLKATRYKVTEHGELGPLLSPRGANTDPPAAT